MMISVNKLLSLDKSVLRTHNLVSGILVTSADNCYLVDKKNNGDWDESSAVLINYKDIKFALMMQVPIKHGSKSVFYNFAEIVGDISIDDSLGFYITPKVIYVQTNKNKPMEIINFTERIISKGKVKHSSFGCDYFSMLNESPPKI